jgi:tetratricopeptide (TPR) repeat protein
MDWTDFMKRGMTDKRKSGKGSMMNIQSVLKLIVAVFFLSILPMPSQAFDKALFSANLYAADQANTEWLEHSIALEQMKDWQGKLDWCLKWTKSEPKNAIAWISLAFAYRSLNRNVDTIDAYRQALRINPENGDAWKNLGIAYDGLKSYDESAEAYRQALRIDPGDADAWKNLGVAYDRLKGHDEATKASR